MHPHELSSSVQVCGSHKPHTVSKIKNKKINQAPKSASKNIFFNTQFFAVIKKLYPIFQIVIYVYHLFINKCSILICSRSRKYFDLSFSLRASKNHILYFGSLHVHIFGFLICQSLHFLSQCSIFTTKKDKISLKKKF